jgi:hypothetical protein
MVARETSFDICFGPCLARLPPTRRRRPPGTGIQYDTSHVIYEGTRGSANKQLKIGVFVNTDTALPARRRKNPALY